MEITQHYNIRQIIGHGSSCTVRKAIKRQTQQQFAVKVYENQRLKAKNEIDMLIRLQHPNIVNIYDAFEDQGTIILVLEYMVGGQLYDMVGTKKTFGEAQVRQYMKAMVDAIRYCHQLGIVHRDIKPENLLLTTKGPDATLKLADFGISKILSEEMLNTNCGTPIYMAPQIWMGEAYDTKVDIWSLGVVMYYLLTGCHPFSGDNESLIENIKAGELKFPGQIWNTISYKAIDLIRLLLQKDPAKRPTAKEVANHLWICHIDEIPKNPFDLQEVNLYKAVRKIKRHIIKQRLKKNTKMLKDILDHKKISRTRMKFLLHESDMSMTAEQNSIDIQN